MRHDGGNVLKTHYRLYVRVSPLKIVPSKQAFNRGGATRMRIPRRETRCISRVARRRAIYTDGSYSQENLSDEADARTLCQRYTMRSACRMQNTTHTTEEWLCASPLIGSFVPSWHISPLLFVGMKDDDSLLSPPRTWNNFANFIYFCFGKRASWRKIYFFLSNESFFYICI